MSKTGDKVSYVLLLRGINVGGNNKLPMKDLKEALLAIGLEDVSHYRQSGNLVFTTANQDTEELEQKIENEIRQRFGFSVPSMIMTAEQFETAVQNFPFAQDDAEKSVLVFLSGDGSGDWADRAKEKITADEKYERVGSVAYLHCPNGLSRSKAAEAVLTKPRPGVKATMRNWRTVNKILDLLNR